MVVSATPQDRVRIIYMKSGIYRIELGNGNYYIGSSVNVSKRKREHLSYLRIEKHCNKRVQRAWNKYQIFDFVILELCDESELIKKEQVLLDLHFRDAKNLNISPVAGSPMLGRRHSEASKAKMSAGVRLRPPMSDATRQKISVAQKNSPLVAESARKRSVLLKGRKPSDETRAAMSKSWRASPLSKAHLEKIHAQPYTEEHCKNIGNALRGRIRGPYGKFTEAQCQHLRESAKTRPPRTPEHCKAISDGMKRRYAEKKLAA